MHELTPYLKKAVALLNKNLDKKIRIISNFDADGISAAAILTKALLRKGCDIQVSIIKQLKDGVLEDLRVQNDDFLLFSDLGSGQVDSIRKYNKPTIILDHHQPQSNYIDEDFVQVNPHIPDMEEDLISAAGLAFLFAETLDPKNVDLSAIVMVGALGDIQESDGRVTGLNEFILDKGIVCGAIKKSRGLRVFGRSTRPIHQALSYCIDPFIPGVSGDESGAVQFLSELNIPIKGSKGWRTLDDLTQDEQQRLGTAIICERINSGEQNVENVFGDVYRLELPEEFSDAKELATTINACGRMSNSAIGVQLLCGDKTAVEKARRVVNGYKKLIGSYVSWIKKNVGTNNVVQGNNAYFIVAGDEIHEHMIGTVSSIIARTTELGPKKPLFGMAYTEDGDIKISGRADGFGINLKEILNVTCKECGGEGGGHSQAAGGYIKKGTETKFIELTDTLIGETLRKTKEEQTQEIAN